MYLQAISLLSWEVSQPNKAHCDHRDTNNADKEEVNDHKTSTKRAKDPSKQYLNRKKFLQNTWIS